MDVNLEEQWIAKAVRNDPESLACLLQHNYTFLYKYMLKVTMNRALAEDLVQETMLKAIENISTFQRKSKFSTWLISIGTRLYLDGMRKQRVERRWQEQEQALRSMRFEAAMRQEDWPDALDALARVGYDIRIPILLKYYYGYAYEEIADWLDIPLGTVKSRIHNGLKQLRKELQGNDEQAEASVKPI
ncbi:RNA polymerase sigma factor SigY [Paenibacillus abyssi]|uniref:RNA polymerase sigma factor n=1 Tax=Paenibacillus abyssi TaxID=1340531 RepID=A0A917FWY6_9BACL|nr:RNA polymerase sigma factor SigY [Paenibacillus abyssi]GGG09217.1 RNA polymerase sigma factor SigY [Paenibacillus abyssi]